MRSDDIIIDLEQNRIDIEANALLKTTYTYYIIFSGIKRKHKY